MLKWFRRRKRVDLANWNEQATRIRAASEDRRRRLVGQEAVVRSIEAMLFKHDPLGINFADNTDEYRPEAETITLRRGEAKTSHDLTRIVHEEFVRWFGEKTAGPESRYEQIALEIWSL